MIAEFPEFSPITESNLPNIVELALGFEHYANFNPVSLWCWNRDYPGGVSQLYGNLIVKWKDATGGEPFLSFTPHLAFQQTAMMLLDYAEHHQLSRCLRAIPVPQQDELTQATDRFTVSEDRDNFEYVLSVDDWVLLAGARFRNKRHAIHRLERHAAVSVRPLAVEDDVIQTEMIRLCYRWARQRGVINEQFQSELTAIRNLFDYAPSNHVFILGAFVDDKLVGFSVNDCLAEHIGIGHFAKADYTYPELYTYLLHQVCVHLQERGMKMLNVEEDLGNPGLRQAKLLLKPVKLLEKAMICPTP